jgi:hypothetical protein
VPSGKRGTFLVAVTLALVSESGDAVGVSLLHATREAHNATNNTKHLLTVLVSGVPLLEPGSFNVNVEKVLFTRHAHWIFHADLVPFSSDGPVVGATSKADLFVFFSTRLRWQLILIKSPSIFFY